MYTTTLLAGERSGNLQEVLERYVSFQNVSLTFRKKLTASLIYPGLLLTLVMRPDDLHVHRSRAAVRPALRPDGLQAARHDDRAAHLWQVDCSTTSSGSLLTALAIAAALWRFSITEHGRDTVDGVRVGLPIFGKIWLKYQVALFSRTLSTLLTGGLPLVPSLETAARVHLVAPRFQGRLHLHRHRSRRQEPCRFAQQYRRLPRPRY